jgi:hypothetical protein
VTRTASSELGIGTGPGARFTAGSFASISPRAAAVRPAPANGGIGTAPSSAAPATNDAQPRRSDASHPNRREACAKTKQWRAAAPVTWSVAAAASAANCTPWSSARKTLIGPAMSGRPLIQPVAA